MSKKLNKLGKPPGSVIYTGLRNSDNIPIHHIVYNTENLTENILNSDNSNDYAIEMPHEDLVTWYDIRGIHNTSIIQKFGEIFNIHVLIMEDITDIYQRPKFDEYDNALFIILRAMEYDKLNKKIVPEQISIYVGNNFVITFQETVTDLFGLVRKRLVTGKGKIRQRGADYLAYTLIDVAVDNYFLVLDGIENEIEQLEDRVLNNSSSHVKLEIHNLKNELMVMRKSIAPLREAISQFSKSDHALLSANTSLYIRDLYDHTILITDNVDTFRDLLNGLHELFISEVSLRMNQVMQVLTIVSSIFIPLTFIAGVYGMNFKYMPELEHPYGYFVTLGVMLFIAIGLLIIFRIKKWI